jgi:hypothetical protein
MNLDRNGSTTYIVSGQACNIKNLENTNGCACMGTLSAEDYTIKDAVLSLTKRTAVMRFLCGDWPSYGFCIRSEE